MTRKDYTQFAQILRATRHSLLQGDKRYDDHGLERIYKDLVDMIACVFSNDNTSFDYEKFRTACGINEE